MVEKEIKRYVGRTVEIVYYDGKQQFTRRTIEIRSIRNGRVMAYCHSRCAPRSFLVENIMAIQPQSRRAV